MNDAHPDTDWSDCPDECEPGDGAFDMLANLHGALVLAFNYTPDETIEQFAKRVPYFDEAGKFLRREPGQCTCDETFPPAAIVIACIVLASVVAGVCAGWRAWA